MHIFSKWWIKLLLILPALTVFCVFTLYPLIATFRVSFFNSRVGSASETFVGWENYIKMFQNEFFWKALSNTIIIWIGLLLLLLPLGLLLGLLLNSSFRGVTAVKTAVFMPYILSGIMVGLIWSFLVDPGFGMINGFLRSIGQGHLAQAWIGGTTLTPYTIIVIETWKTVGFYAILFMAGLKMIPKDCMEAALIDGATPRQRTWYVTIPLLKEQVKICAVIISINALKIFELIVVLTGGGPNRQSNTLSTLVFQQYFSVERNYGIGATTAIFQFFAIMITTIFFLQLTRKRVDE